MHIPDGYLSPQTYIPLYAAMVPFWGIAASKVKKRLRSRHVPLLALGAAFSFVTMMFNIPVPGGTTGHAVGGVVVAVLLGPWAACVAVSLVLVIQALLFGDGGITALAANCFTMAVVMPFTGYYCYRLIAGNAAATAKRRMLAGAVAGYLALNAAALYTAILFGIQPLLASGPDGKPLYAPYPLSVAVPAMALEHLFLFGFIEALVTALVIRYLQQADPALLSIHNGEDKVRSATTGQLWWGLALLACFTPLGVILPAAFNGGAAWGEWSSRDIERMLGFIPNGMKGLSGLWQAPFTGYTIAGGERHDIPVTAVAYLISALVGIVVIAAAVKLAGRFLSTKDHK